MKSAGGRGWESGASRCERRQRRTALGKRGSDAPPHPPPPTPTTTNPSTPLPRTPRSHSPTSPPPPPPAPARHITGTMASNKQSQRPFASLTYKPSLSICSLEARLMKGAVGEVKWGMSGGWGGQVVLIWKMSPQRSARCVVSCCFV